jgi:hypothetical protein
MTHRPTRRTAITLAAAILALWGVNTPVRAASAQPQSAAQTQTKWVAVAKDDEPLRCGDQDIYYAVANLAQGTVLQSEGTSALYTKVRYPADLGAYVPADEAQAIGTGDTIRLTTESRLRAASLLRGLEGSWSPVFATPIPASTELRVLSIERDDSGNVTAYKVRPPVHPSTNIHAIAYIRTDALRDATPAEIEAHTSAKPAPATTTNVQPEAKPQAQAEQQPAPTDAPPVSNELLEDTQLPETTPESQPAAQPEQQPATEPAQIRNTAPRTVDTAGSITVSSLEQLESAFTRARAMPRAELDQALSELRAEYQRAINDAQGDEGLVTSLSQRLAWIDLRIETRDARRAIENALAQADEQTQALRAKIDQWESSRAYALVGTINASSVYTGDPLPLLFRVSAPDPITGIDRTVGYVAPTDTADPRRFLGKLVGVVGPAVRDDQLGRSVVRASRIVDLSNQ